MNGMTPEPQKMKPLKFVSHLILTMKRAPRHRVVDVAFDIVCRRYGYIPKKVLEWLRAEGYVFLDDSHPDHRVIGLTKKGLGLGA